MAREGMKTNTFGNRNIWYYCWDDVIELGVWSHEVSVIHTIAVMGTSDIVRSISFSEWERVFFEEEISS
jgi:hypothetical protein